MNARSLLLGSNSLAQNILQFGRSHPDKRSIRLLMPNAKDLVLTYGDLIRNGARFANYFKEKGVKPKEVVVLVLKHGPELVYSFVGALLYGAIPSIFAHPSVKIPPEAYFQTLLALLKVSATPYVVTYPELADNLKNMTSITLLLADEYTAYSDKFSGPSYDPDDIVLLQHSSGTTGLKKGVALSNRSVMNQLRNYSVAIDLGDTDKIVSWLPLYHDMGLIACFVLPLASGVPLVLMSPFDWVENPVKLFKALSEEKGTLAWLPNFSYNFLAANISPSQMEGINLSSVRAFVNCAEPVSADSHDLFFEKFKPYGLKKKALGTCYAMAENTFAVTQGGIGKLVRVEVVDAKMFTSEKKAVPLSEKGGPSRRLVSSGELIPHNEVRIVDEKKRDLPDRYVGEILLRSDSLFTEYFHRPDITQTACLDGWYLTGDLGFVLEGHLFVTGRKKDMIITAGKNIYPQDIEDVVSAVPGVVPGRVAGFGVYNDANGTEDVVVLAETEEKDPPQQLGIKLAIAREVRDRLECVANEIVLLPRLWLQKSSSGKISRSANREKYLKEFRRNHVVS